MVLPELKGHALHPQDVGHVRPSVTAFRHWYRGDAVDEGMQICTCSSYLCRSFLQMADSQDVEIVEHAFYAHWIRVSSSSPICSGSLTAWRLLLNSARQYATHQRMTWSNGPIASWKPPSCAMAALDGWMACQQSSWTFVLSRNINGGDFVRRIAPATRRVSMPPPTNLETICAHFANTRIGYVHIWIFL